MAKQNEKQQPQAPPEAAPEAQEGKAFDVCEKGVLMCDGLQLTQSGGRIYATLNGFDDKGNVRDAEHKAAIVAFWRVLAARISASGGTDAYMRSLIEKDIHLLWPLGTRSKASKAAVKSY